jgi:hypothetical protein
VPKLFPRLSAWKGDSQISPKGLISTLKTEKRTLQNIFLIASIIIFKEQIVYFFQKVL